MYSIDEQKMMNKTCRSSGAIKPVVPRYVASIATRLDRILDFGAGKGAIQARELRNLGLNVDAYDISDNFVKGTHTIPSGKYSIVYASNVLNVQPDRERLIQVIKLCKTYLNIDGLFVCNFPKEPRKNNVSDADFGAILLNEFEFCKKVGSGIYICTI